MPLKSSVPRDPGVEESVRIFRESSVKATPQQIGFIRKNRIKHKNYLEIRHLVEDAERLSGGTLSGYGDEFRDWCKRHGRVPPRERLIKAMNEDPEQTHVHIHKILNDNPESYRAYYTFMTRSG